MYAGPCYVVTANGALDYFGRRSTSRPACSTSPRSGELVAPHDLFVASGGSSLLREAGRFGARVKGVDAPLDLVRATLREPAGAAAASESAPA